jgi:hypothetical protein
MLSRVTPACPRCNYDLSGQVAAWTDACPLRSTCPECGGKIEWPEPFHRIHRPPHWSFEHGSVTPPVRWATTSLATLVPWVLWRCVRPRYELHPRQLGFLAATWLLIAHLAGVTGVWLFGYTYTHQIPQPLDHVPFWLWPWKGDFDVMWPGGGGMSSNLSIFAAMIFIPSLLIPPILLLAGTMRRFRLPRRHVVRVAAYSVPFAMLLAVPYFVSYYLAELLHLRFGVATGVHPAVAPITLALVLWHPVALCVWWGFALRSYFGVRAVAWATAALLLAMAPAFLAVVWFLLWIGFRP